jgi:hypothetical protein
MQEGLEPTAANLFSNCDSYLALIWGEQPLRAMPLGGKGVCSCNCIDCPSCGLQPVR